MSRYNSTAQESNLSEDKASYIEDFGEQKHLEAIHSRHVAIGEEWKKHHPFPSMVY